MCRTDINAATVSRSILGAFLLLGILYAPSVAQSSFEQGERWYSQRATNADSFRADPRYINNAIQAFKESLQTEKPSEETAIYLLKCSYFKGMFTGLDEDLQKKVYDWGKEFGEEMAELYPESAPIKFWYAANIGRWAALHGFVASATSGIAQKVRRLSNEVIELDPEYLGGGGYRILAQVHFHAPSIPLVLGWPSDKTALKMAQQAIGVAPDHPSNRLLYAEILLEFNEDQQAKMHLDHLAKQMEPRHTHLAEDRYVKYRAEELLRDHY